MRLQILKTARPHVLLLETALGKTLNRHLHQPPLTLLRQHQPLRQDLAVSTLPIQMEPRDTVPQLPLQAGVCAATRPLMELRLAPILAVKPRLLRQDQRHWLAQVARLPLPLCLQQPLLYLAVTSALKRSVQSSAIFQATAQSDQSTQDTAAQA